MYFLILCGTKLFTIDLSYNCALEPPPFQTIGEPAPVTLLKVRSLSFRGGNSPGNSPWNLCFVYSQLKPFFVIDKVISEAKY